MPAIPLDVGDAIGLAKLLQLLSDWLEADHDNLTASLARFVGSLAYVPGSLRDVPTDDRLPTLARAAPRPHRVTAITQSYFALWSYGPEHRTDSYAS